MKPRTRRSIRVGYSRSRVHDGFTAIELMVCIGVVSLLLAILLPAVQMAREGGRSSLCRSNLHQVSLAFGAYEHSYRVFPGSLYTRRYYDQIADHLELRDGQSAPVLACPSDPYGVGDTRFGRISYRVNDGTYDYHPGDGFYGYRGRYRNVSDITDGLSNSAALAESLTLPYDEELALLDFRRLSPKAQRWFFTSLPRSHPAVVDFAAECEHRPAGIGHTPVRYETYNHVMTPNRPSCYNGFPDNTERQPRAATSNSEHPCGVNAAFCDGRIQFVAESVAREIWWAAGTRAGGESLQIRSF
jgi:prepilin-type N-terminal cleavage/methylation domain-containing protein